MERLGVRWDCSKHGELEQLIKTCSSVAWLWTTLLPLKTRIALWGPKSSIVQRTLEQTISASRHAESDNWDLRGSLTICLWQIVWIFRRGKITFLNRFFNYSLGNRRLSVPPSFRKLSVMSPFIMTVYVLQGRSQLPRATTVLQWVSERGRGPFHTRGQWSVQFCKRSRVMCSISQSSAFEEASIKANALAIPQSCPRNTNIHHALHELDLSGSLMSLFINEYN